jgi:hypothetical protein
VIVGRKDTERVTNRVVEVGAGKIDLDVPSEPGLLSRRRERKVA